MLKYIEGGVCAPRGFRAAGAHCGFRRNKNKKDLALIVSDVACSAAAVYTKNKVYGAPLAVTREHLADGRARAVICNSGNANTCAENSIYVARQTCILTAQAIGCRPEDVIVASTGVIGKELTMDAFEKGIPCLKELLHENGSLMAAEAIMTTDTIKKEMAATFRLGGKTCRIGCIAKGSGMVHPNMATVLAFFTTDAAIRPEMLNRALGEAVKASFNQVSVDGETSTNDMVAILANGLAKNPMIERENHDYEIFRQVLTKLACLAAEKVAADGEGASKLLICRVNRGRSRTLAQSICRSVVSSSLVKTAVFGEDANWGRVLCAVGYTPGDFSVDNIDVELRSSHGTVTVCKGSKSFAFNEEKASEILSDREITIAIDLHDGEAEGIAWGCDLTPDYVRMNSDYRSIGGKK